MLSVIECSYLLYLLSWSSHLTGIRLQIFTPCANIECFVLSDLHADVPINQTWLNTTCSKLSTDKDVFRILIVPGKLMR